jgi:hypothetical protein
MVTLVKNTFKSLWFRDLKEETIHINDAAVRVRGK